MKKIFNSFLLKRILFNFDYIVAMFLPFILTILAAVPLYGNKDIEPFGWPLLLIQIFWVGFIFIGIRNTFPKEDDDSRNFIPFINILATLPPLNLLIFVKFFDLPDYYYLIPSALVPPFYALTVTSISRLIEKSRVDDNRISIIQSSILNSYKILKENQNVKFSSKMGEKILAFIEMIREASEPGEKKTFMLSIFEEISMKNVAIKTKRPSFAKILEMHRDDEYVNLSIPNAVNGGLFLKRVVVDYMIKLFKYSYSEDSYKFTRVRKNCPFYENGEMPYTTARGWVKNYKELIIAEIEKRKIEDYPF